MKIYFRVMRKGLVAILLIVFILCVATGLIARPHSEGYSPLDRSTLVVDATAPWATITLNNNTGKSFDLKDIGKFKTAIDVYAPLASGHWRIISGIDGFRWSLCPTHEYFGFEFVSVAAKSMSQQLGYLETSQFGIIRESGGTYSYTASNGQVVVEGNGPMSVSLCTDALMWSDNGSFLDAQFPIVFARSTLREITSALVSPKNIAPYNWTMTSEDRPIQVLDETRFNANAWIWSNVPTSLAAQGGISFQAYNEAALQNQNYSVWLSGVLLGIGGSSLVAGSVEMYEALERRRKLIDEPEHRKSKSARRRR